MAKPSAINPAFPVWDKDVKAAMLTANVNFDVVKVNTFSSPRYAGQAGNNGLTWRVFAQRYDTGETGILLFTANAVRSEQLGAFRATLEEDGETIGPCKLSMRHLEGKARGQDETWEIVDGDDDAVPFNANI